ncbi:MAG: extracellular solute-binding protein, partial [Ruminococcus sp.]|nr:extracellular solute-binding protein [Ruminococcus sp.]
TALTLAILTVGAFTSCGEDKPEDIRDSQEEAENDTPADEPITLTLDTPYNIGSLASAVAEYNRSQDDYIIELKSRYTTSEFQEDPELWKKSFNELKLDMVSGKTADIIAVEPHLMGMFVDLGMFTDMYALMEQYDGVKKEELLPNILEGFEVDGELPAISYGFYIRTAAAKTRYVGEDAESWTPEQAMAAYNAMPDDLTFLQDGDTSQLVWYMTKTAQFSYIDEESSTCNFTDSSFVDMLELACGNPKGGNIGEDDMVKQLILNAFGGQAADFYSQFGGEDVTFVGFPSEDGYGAAGSSAMMFGISESCQNKEGAWDFICYLLSKRYQRDLLESDMNRYFPILKEVFDEQAFEQDTEALSHDNMWYFLVQTYENNPDADLTPEQAQQKLYDYLTTLKFTPYYGRYGTTELENIISEECQAAAAGGSTAQECADLLQNRISIYLSERA